MAGNRLSRTIPPAVALLAALAALTLAPTAVAPGCNNFAPPFNQWCEGGWVDPAVDYATAPAFCLLHTAPVDWVETCA